MDPKGMDWTTATEAEWEAWLASIHNPETQAAYDAERAKAVAGLRLHALQQELRVAAQEPPAAPPQQSIAQGMATLRPLVGQFFDTIEDTEAYISSLRDDDGEAPPQRRDASED